MNTLFELGQVVATTALVHVLESRGLSDILRTAINRHALGDWGDVCAEDAQANDEALRNGDRLFSSYEVDEHLTIWVITEADRSATTALLPSDY